MIEQAEDINSHSENNQVIQPQKEESNLLLDREKLRTALNQGYTHEQIYDYLSKKEDVQPKLNQAAKAGYNPVQIIDYFKDKPSEKEKEVAKGFKFFGYTPKPETIRDVRDKAGVQLKSVARGTGTYGNLANLPINIGAKIVNSFGGRGDVFKAVLKEIVPGAKLPTSEEMGDYFEKFSGQKFSPKSDEEKLFSNITENTIGSMSMGMPLSAAVKGASLGQGLRFVGEGLGLPEWANTGLEITGNVLGSANYGGINKYKSDLYKNVTKNLPEDAMTKATQLENQLSTLKSSLTKTGLQKSAAPAKNKVIQIIDEVQSNIKDGKINIKNAWDIRKDIYSLLGENYKEVTGYKTQLKQVNNYLNQTLKSTKSTYPAFYENLQKADKFFGDAAKFQKSIKFIDSIKEAEKLSVGFNILNGNWLGAAKMMGMGGITNFVGDLLKSPRILRFYGKGIASAAKQNRFGVVQAAKNIENEVNQELDKKRRNQK